MLLYDLCISDENKHLLLWKKAQKAKIISLGKVNLNQTSPQTLPASVVHTVYFIRDSL